MTVMYIPLLSGTPSEQEQLSQIQSFIANGWIQSGSIYDKDQKTVIEAVLMLPNDNTPGFSTKRAPVKKELAVPVFAIGEPVKIVGNPDPQWNDEEGILTTSALIGATGKYYGLYTGNSKYKGYAIVRMDKYDYRLHFCEGAVSDCHGFFCKVESLVSLAEKEDKTVSDELKVGSMVRFIKAPNTGLGEMGDMYIGKEGTIIDIDSDHKTAKISILNQCGDDITIKALIGTFVSTSIYVPKHAMTLSSGDIVKIIALESTGNQSLVDRMAYVCGPISSVMNDKIMNHMDNIRVQVGILGSLSSPSSKMEQRLTLNVNCLEVIKPESIFSGIKIGDTVTIVDVPDCVGLGMEGKKWIGREGKFLGFPKPIKCSECGITGGHSVDCKVKTGLHYRYKYSAELEVEDGKKLYAFANTIVKGKASELNVFRVGDIVEIMTIVGTNASSAAFEKRYKGQHGKVSDIHYEPSNENHGKYYISFPLGTVLADKSALRKVSNGK